MPTHGLKEEQADTMQLLESGEEPAAMEEARGSPRGKQWAIVVPAFLLLSTLGAVAVWLQRASGIEPPKALGAAVVNLAERRRWTDKFGWVAEKMTVSGVDCPGTTNSALNGVYTYQGLTHDGRAFYRAEKGDDTLYYDRECNGDKDGENSQFGTWRVHAGYAKVDQSAIEDLDHSHDCSDAMVTIYPDHPHAFSPLHKPYYHREKAKGSPPQSTYWNVYCGKKQGMLPLKVEFSNGASAVHTDKFKVKGHWKYLYTGFPGEEKEFTYGIEKGSDRGGSNEVGAEIGASATIGGQVPFVAQESLELSASAHEQYASTWNDATATTEEESRKITFPEDGTRLALFQWVFEVTDANDKKGLVTTKELVLRPNAAHPPLCYPGLYKAGVMPLYDKWEPGGEIGN